MNRGKELCEFLKSIRLKAAEKYGLRYEPREWREEEGDCMGTCPRCDEELRDLQRQLEENGIEDVEFEGEIEQCLNEYNNSQTDDGAEDVKMLQGDVVPDEDDMGKYDAPCQHYKKGLPFPRRKLLKECRVAGIGFHNIDEVWEELYVGAEIALVRERDNKYDKNAVAVALANDYGGKPEDFDFDYILGYIPRGENSDIATMLDMGWQDILEAEISQMDRNRPMADRLHISIYLKNKDYDEERTKLLRVAELSNEEMKDFQSQIMDKGFALCRWVCVRPYGELLPDLPERGNKVVLMHRHDNQATLYLLYTLAAEREEVLAFVDEEQIDYIDGRTAFVMTVIAGPIQVCETKLAFLKEEDVGHEPDKCLSKEASERLLSLFDLTQIGH